jgi:hypothetical protein
VVEHTVPGVPSMSTSPGLSSAQLALALSLVWALSLAVIVLLPTQPHWRPLSPHYF